MPKPTWQPRAVSSQLRADLATEHVELSATRMSSPANLAALQARLDVMTKAHDDEVENTREARTSLPDVEAGLPSSSDTPSSSIIALHARVEALKTGLATSNKALQKVLTAQAVAETGRLNAEVAIGFFRSDVNGIIGRI